MYPLHFGIRDPFKTKRKYTMSKSISTKLKTIVKQSTNLSLELTAAPVELLEDVAKLSSASIAGKAGQGLVTVWNEDEATSNSDKEGQ
jgi:hypothetical protein